MFENKQISTFKENQQGLGKTLFGRFLRRLAKEAEKFVRNVPIIGEFVADGIREIGNVSDWLDAKETVYVLTAAEDNIVDSWMGKRFGPWIQGVANNLSTALQSSNFQIQLEGMNKAMIQMCVARTYYLTNDRAGLSNEAVNSRNNTVEVVFAPIEQLINTTIETFPKQFLKVSVSSGNVLTKSDFTPIIGNYSTFTHNYSCTKFVLPAGVSVGNAIFAPATTSIVPTPNPQVIYVEHDNGVVPATTVPQASAGETIPAGAPILIPMTPQADNQPNVTVTDKNFLQKNAVPLLIGGVAVALLLSGKKKKN